jgi:hypothetical protein
VQRLVVDDRQQEEVEVPLEYLATHYLVTLGLTRMRVRRSAGWRRGISGNVRRAGIRMLITVCQVRQMFVGQQTTSPYGGSTVLLAARWERLASQSSPVLVGIGGAPPTELARTSTLERPGVSLRSFLICFTTRLSLEPELHKPRVAGSSPVDRFARNPCKSAVVTRVRVQRRSST